MKPCAELSLRNLIFLVSFEGKACTSDGWPSRVVSADTLAMFPHGNVHITAEPSFREVCTDTLKHFVSVECSLTPSFSNKAVERVRFFYSILFYLGCFNLKCRKVFLKDFTDSEKRLSCKCNDYNFYKI